MMQANIHLRLAVPEDVPVLRELIVASVRGLQTQDYTPAQIEGALKTVAAKLECKTGDLVHPARVAASGRSVGPSLYHMLEVMGKERVLQRFDRMRSKLGVAA